MKFLISQPATLYYAWQTEVLLNNLLDLGLQLKDVEIVCSGLPTQDWLRLACHYPANFSFYTMTSESNYPSISRPNALKQHYRRFPELGKYPTLYIDCDILFLKSPEIFLKGLLSDEVVYLSDCKYYIGYSYFKSKEKQVTKNTDRFDMDDVLKELCKRVSLDFELLTKNDDQSGGAQYLFKKLDFHFWEDVERDCHEIYNYFNFNSPGSVNNTYFHSENEGIQSFCSDMWAVLWNLWKRGIETKIAKDLNFAWPSYPYKEKDAYNIFHNAGITDDKEGMFYKSKYQNIIPYSDCFEKLDKGKLSYLYTEKVMELNTKSCLI